MGPQLTSAVECPRGMTANLRGRQMGEQALEVWMTGEARSEFDRAKDCKVSCECLNGGCLRIS